MKHLHTVVPTFDLEKSNFKAWKDKMLSILNAHTTEARERAFKLDHRVDLGFTYKDILIGRVKKPSPPVSDNLSKDELEIETKGYRIRNLLWQDMTSQLISMLINNIPSSFWESHGVSYADSGENYTANELWLKVTKYFENSTDDELRKAAREWFRSLAMQYNSVSEFIKNASLKRAKVNQYSQKVYGKDLILEEWFCVSIMMLMPGMVNVDSSLKKIRTIDELETRLRDILGSKNRNQVVKDGGIKCSVYFDTHDPDRPKPSRKRTSAEENEADTKRQKPNKGPKDKSEISLDYCHYCKGTYNSGGKGHGYLDCSKMKDDRNKGIVRKNIFSSFEQVGKYRPNVKSDKAKRFKDKVEVVVEVNSIRVFREIENHSTSGEKDSLDLDDHLDPLQEEVNFFVEAENHNIITNDDDSDASMDFEIADCFKRYSKQRIALEEKVRKTCPSLLKQPLEKSDDDWVLDSGCGYHLTKEGKYFLRKEVDNSLSFRYGNGRNLRSTHKGSIKLFLFGLNGVLPFIIPNVALVPNQTTNILSEFQLKRSGIQIIDSADAKHKYLLHKQTVIGVARAINGVYYLQNMNWRTRQVVCALLKQNKYNTTCH